MRHAHRLIALLLAATACGSEDAPAAPPTTPSFASERPVDHTPAAPLPFDVHEWGLVEVDGSAYELATGPGAHRGELDLAKPILYFHAEPGAVVPLDVVVRLPVGEAVEHWPATTTTERSVIAWRGLSLGDCVAPPTLRIPHDLAEARCTSSDGVCESQELAHYVTDDARCLHGADGTEAPFLFYRGRGSDAPLPYRVRASDEGVVLTGEADATGDGAVFFVSRRPDGVAITRGVLPAIGASSTLARPTTSSDDDLPAFVAVLRAAGLDEAEANTFMRAWTAELFGPTTTMSRTTDAVLYVLPLAAAARLATLEITPAPRVLRRVIVARVVLASQAGARAGYSMRLDDTASLEMEVRASLLHATPSLRRCLDTWASSHEAPLPPTWSVDLALDAEGHARSVTVEPRRVLGSSTEDCVRRAAATWTFPPGQPGRVHAPFAITRP